MILAKPNHIKIYGHRGARGDLPENTLDSFKYLFENNINAYETDILISKDLIPVITHDFRLDPSLTKDDEGNWITDENIKLMNKYFMSIGFIIIVEIFTIEEYLSNMKLPNYFHKKELIKDDTHIKDIYYEMTSSGKIYRITFNFLK